MSKHSTRCECSRHKDASEQACPRCARLQDARDHKPMTGIRRRKEFIRVTETKFAFTRWLAERGLETK